jgi:hypothetical protein
MLNEIMLAVFAQSAQKFFVLDMVAGTQRFKLIYPHIFAHFFAQVRNFIGQKIAMSHPKSLYTLPGNPEKRLQPNK